MARLLDLPSEVLQLILRYAIPATLEHSVHDAAPRCFEGPRNPQLPFLLVNKRLLAEVSVLTPTQLSIHSTKFEWALPFVICSGSRLRRHISSIRVVEATSVSDRRFEHIANDYVSNMRRSMELHLPVWFDEVTMEETGTYWDESSMVYVAVSAWKVQKRIGSQYFTRVQTQARNLKARMALASV